MGAWRKGVIRRTLPDGRVQEFVEGRWMSKARAWQIRKQREGKCKLCGKPREGRADLCPGCTSKISDSITK